MTKEETKILLQDLCSRLPYGFIVHRYSDNVDIKINTIDDFSHFLEYSNDEEFKPYLRPLSSMTEDEKKELRQISEEYFDDWSTADSNLLKWELDAKVSAMRATFYNSHHLDWNGLIEKGLALEAPEDMYI